MEVGDVMGREYYRDGDYTFTALALVDGRVEDIAWRVAEGNSDLKNITKFVDGKIRLDLKKVLEIDPNAKGVPGSGVKFSRSGSDTMSDIISEGELDLNTILEQSKGVGKNKTFSAAKANAATSCWRYKEP